MADVVGEAGILIVPDDTGLSAKIKAIAAKASERATIKLNVDVDKKGSTKTKLATQTLGQLQFSFLKVGAAATGVVSSVAPVGPALVGIAASAVALAGSLVEVAGLAAPAIVGLSAFGAAAVAAKVGLIGFTDATDAQAKAYEELARTGEVSVATQENLDAALKRLAPSALAVVKGFAELRPELEGVRRSVQQDLFAGLAGPLADLAQRVLPLARDRLGEFATTLNEATREFIDFAAQPATLSRFNSTLRTLNRILGNLLGAAGDLAAGLGNIFVGAIPSAETLTGKIDGLAARFRKWTEEINADGSLRRFFRRGIQAAGLLGSTVSNLTGIFATTFAAGSTSGQGILRLFDDLTSRFNDFLKTPDGQDGLASFFATIAVLGGTLKTVFALVAPIIGGIIGAFQEAGPAIAEFRAALAPVLTIIGQEIGNAFRELGPVLSFIFSALAKVITFIAPAAPLIGKVAGFFILLAVGVGAAAKAAKALGLIWKGITLIFRVNPFVALAALVSAQFDRMVAGAREFVNAVIRFFKSIPGAVDQYFREAAQRAQSRLDALVVTAKQIPTNIVNAFRGLGSRIMDAIGSIDIGSLITGAGGRLGQLAGFATGAIVDRPTVGVFGDAGRELLIPAEPGARWVPGLEAAFRDVAAQRGIGAVGNTVNLTVVVPTADPEAVAARVLDRLVLAGIA